MVRSVGQSFTKPEQDWVPTIFLLDREEKLSVGGIDPRFFQSEQLKDALSQVVLPAFVKDQHAVCSFLLVSTWVVKGGGDTGIEQEDLEQYQSLGDYPGSEEALTLIAIRPGEVEVFQALILRDGEQPPALAPWEHVGSSNDKDGMGFEGRMVEPIYQAILENEQEVKEEDDSATGEVEGGPGDPG